MVWWVTNFDPLAASLTDTTLFGLDVLIWLILLLIVVYDVKHKIIPDRFSLVFALLAGILALSRLYWVPAVPHFIPFFGVYTPLWLDLLAGPLLALPFALLWLFSGGRAMGLGDAKLAWGLGWFLGFSGGVSAIILAFWTAFFPSIILLFLPRKHFTMKSEIPFAPFLILGALLVYVWGIDILQWSF
jgi:leader peptidase (prepilin peptidase)/N-methyltransferase